MTDIVERLRDWSPIEPPEVCEEAANEIKRLRDDALTLVHRPVTQIDVVCACEVLLHAGYNAEALSVLVRVFNIQALQALDSQKE